MGGEPRRCPAVRRLAEPGVLHDFSQLLSRELADPAGPQQYRAVAVEMGVVKNGDVGSWTSACLSDSDATQNTITSR